mmetsp:Transcript_28503/g.50492  ORF Transcript_28503/g.50492 Transcript_28503/m.50492 type:complete len:196 (-) Transcript_28503:338-925(-)
MTTSTSEAIFIPIDLEASLGRIEDSANEQSMQCEPITRTSPGTPFRQDSNSFSIAPYPISETPDEIKERQRLTESVGSNWTLVTPSSLSSSSDANQPQPLRLQYHEFHDGDDDSMMEVTATEALEDDDFSLTGEDTESLAHEDLQLERIEDPVSFWEETAVPPAATAESKNSNSDAIPGAVSFSSSTETESSMEW